MKTTRTAAISAVGTVLAIGAVAAASDGEWPPAADPQWGGSQVVNNPEPSSHLYLNRIELILPSSPGKEYAEWLTHQHTGGDAKYATDFAIGNIDDDPADEIVITNGGEAVLAADLVLDYDNGNSDYPVSGTLTPIWFWLSESVADPDWNDEPMADVPTPPGDHSGDKSRYNPLIWNVVPDGQDDDTNEVIFTGLDADGQKQIYILRTAPSLPQGYEFVVDSDLRPDDKFAEARISICKVTDSSFPRDIVATEHHDGPLNVFSYQGGRLDRLYSGSFDDGSSEPAPLAKTHECSWYDIDGDGYDEFFLNGLVDFVDPDPLDGTAKATSSIWGLARWQIVDESQANGSHTDQCMVADWDPNRPGLEVYAVVELGSGSKWVDPVTGEEHAGAYDLLYDADCGTLLNEWVNAPAQDGQSIFGGNWTDSIDGLEAILTPKDLAGESSGGSLVIPPGQKPLTGSYVAGIEVTPDPLVDDFQTLAIDGAIHVGDALFSHENPLPIRSGGPWRGIKAVDWDGDYRTDEILHHADAKNLLMLFRLGVKAELDLSNLPPGIPTEAQTLEDPPITEGGVGYHYWYYQGQDGDQLGSWNWQFGGPGRHTHYFEKLGEHHPGTGRWGGVVVRPYDIHGTIDHREEILAISVQGESGPEPRLHIYFNDKPLAPGVPKRPSPSDSLVYRQARLNGVGRPLDFQKETIPIRRFYVRPENSGAPASAFGLMPGTDRQLEAWIEYEDGSEWEVTSHVDWVQDSASAAYGGWTVSGGLVSHLSADGTVSGSGSTSDSVSARIHATMDLEGTTARVSEPVHVFTSDRWDPVILRAGFTDTWLTTFQHENRDLVIEARAVNRGNLAMTIDAYNLDGTLWEPYGPGNGTVRLYDNGQGGDEFPMDGVYTATVEDLHALPAGDFALALRARLTNVPYAVESAPWPFLATGSASTSAPWVFTPQPSPSDESDAYTAPRVRSMGYRGWDTANRVVIEVEVAPTPLYPSAPVQVYASVPGLGIHELNSEGGGLFSLVWPPIGVSSPTPFDYFGAISVATSIHDGNQVIFSDFAPSLSVHSYPTWDTDEPSCETCGTQAEAPLDSCMEPSGW